VVGSSLALAFCQGRSAAFLTAVSTLVDGAVSTLVAEVATPVDDAVSTLVDDVAALVDGVSAPGDRASAGAGFAPGTIISGSVGAGRSSSLSDFAASFGASASSILLWVGALRFCAGAASEEDDGAATLIAITGPRPIKQNRVSHIVLGNKDLGNKDLGNQALGNHGSCRNGATGEPIFKTEFGRIGGK
jgi:hypothetical protein